MWYRYIYLEILLGSKLSKSFKCTPVVAGDRVRVRKMLGGRTRRLGVLGVSCILGVVTITYLLFIQIQSLHPDLQGLDKRTSFPIVVILILRQIIITVL